MVNYITKSGARVALGSENKLVLPQCVDQCRNNILLRGALSNKGVGAKVLIKQSVKTKISVTIESVQC